MGLDMLDCTALQQLADLAAVNRVSDQAVKFPADYPLRLSLLYSRQHI